MNFEESAPELSRFTVSSGKKLMNLGGTDPDPSF
jgi:hypothetical protein